MVGGFWVLDGLPAVFARVACIIYSRMPVGNIKQGAALSLGLATLASNVRMANVPDRNLLEMLVDV